jgi:D-alanine-D-alanine ligase
MYLAFVYNLRRRYPSPEKPETFLEADFDDQKTIDLMVKHLKDLGFEVFSVEANTKAEKVLLKNRKKIDLIFNYSEKIVGITPKRFMAEVYERCNLPFIGCPNSTQKVIMNKALMEDILLESGISTLPHQVFTSSGEPLEKLIYPLIVKPLNEGSSAGITNKSVVNNEKELKRQVNLVTKTFGGRALVEPFLTGREFSIGMLGNPPTLFPIIEPDHTKLPKGYYPMDSLEVKWIFEEEVGGDYFDCPAKISKAIKRRIEKISLNTWKVLKIRDYCRIDMRMDKGKLYVLDVTSPPGLIPPEITETSYFPFAAKVAGLDYDQLLLAVIETATKRLKI